jgi:hypothetical protein
MTARRLMEITRLSPKEALGPNTRTLALYKCEDGVTIHFVYYDRHGWYCDREGHGGRDCPAVAEAKDHEQELSSKRV